MMSTTLEQFVRSLSYSGILSADELDAFSASVKWGGPILSWDRIPEVTVTAVDLPGLDMKAVKRLAKELKVRFHARPYDEVG